MTDDSSKSEETDGTADLAAELGMALESGEFFLVYQPTIDLQTNGFAGVESLLRWRHPTRGVLTPDHFLDVLDSSGLMAAVGRWALRTACFQGSAWHDRGYRFAVSVNVSTRQFADDGFTSDVAAALAASGFDPQLLMLEVSQSTLASDEGRAKDRLQALHEIGVLVAIDDVEPGPVALATIERFPIDVLKLDRSVTSAVTSSSEAQTRIQELVLAARARHLQIIAAGIEDADQRRRLQLDDVAIGQGFLFSRPHEAHEIDRYLEDFSIFSGKPL